ncbi:MAG: hypothetical protein JW786_05030 [Desulfobacterales bacterium]|nr:hypothetical protein [Desulfobacterales bacterium]
MKAFADKLIDVTERHAGEISEQWCKAVRTNPRTPSYHLLTQDQCVLSAVEFCDNLRRIYFSEKPYTEVHEYFRKYAEERIKEKISLDEAVYALIMIRRHIWLFADSQALVVTGVDLQQCVETINKTIRIFDYGIYDIIQTYQRMK